VDSNGVNDKRSVDVQQERSSGGKREVWEKRSKVVLGR